MAKAKELQEFHTLIGRAIAGNGRLAGGGTLLEKYPERYRNVLTDWVDLLIAEAKAKQSLELADRKIEESETTNA
jgi:hypothetical protein